jgi:hypothetical protein
VIQLAPVMKGLAGSGVTFARESGAPGGPAPEGTRRPLAAAAFTVWPLAAPAAGTSVNPAQNSARASIGMRIRAVTMLFGRSRAAGTTHGYRDTPAVAEVGAR